MTNDKQIKFFRIIVLVAMMRILSGCSVYSTGFNCPESRGARCTMLSEVDKRVDSGEIETIYKNCKSGRCVDRNNKTLNVPKKSSNQIHKVKITPKGSDEYQEGNDLYLRS